MPYKLLRGELDDLLKELNKLEEEGYSITPLAGVYSSGGNFYAVVYKSSELCEKEVSAILNTDYEHNETTKTFIKDFEPWNDNSRNTIFHERSDDVHDDDETISRNKWFYDLLDFLYITK